MYLSMCLSIYLCIYLSTIILSILLFLSPMEKPTTAIYFTNNPHFPLLYKIATWHLIKIKR